MARPRIEVAGGIFHVMARGNARDDVFLDEFDYLAFLRRLSETVNGLDWRLHGFCLLPNHYHLLLETPEPNLGRGMLRLNGAYARRFNSRHKRVGHVFQGPYRALLLERDAHLLELCRYLALNPVRAGLCAAPEDWPWSSYAGLAGAPDPPSFLTLDLVHALFGGPAGFAAFVQPGINLVAGCKREN